jgi:exodeoxyribonuclease VII large subunit
MQEGRKLSVRALGRELILVSPRAVLHRMGHRAAAAFSRLKSQTASCAQSWRHRLGVVAGQLDALSPLKVLERGYAVARLLPDRRLITDASRLTLGDRLLVTLQRGEVEAEVLKILEATRG